MPPLLSLSMEGDGDFQGSGALEDGGQDADKEVIQELYQKVKKTKSHIDNYINLFAFIVLAVLYFTILLLQADSSNTYSVSTAHNYLLPDGLTGEGGYSFPSTAAIYDWLNTKIVQEIWQNSNCGNGICERPDDFPAFGRFGCPSDCGYREKLSKITITFVLSLSSLADMLQSNWNLCMVYPASLCWYEEPVVFSSLLGTNVTELLIPDGNWTLTVNAPNGGVTGSVVYRSTYAWETPDAISPGATLVSLSNCAANESETPLEVCRQVAGRIVQCAEDACTSQKRSIRGPAASTGLFVDLVGLCNLDFASLDSYSGMDCATIASSEYDGSTDFLSIVCNDPDDPPSSGSRRLLQDGASWSSSPAFDVATQLSQVPDPASSLPERQQVLAELTTNSSQLTATLWNKLGPTNAQRFYNLRAATHRALYGWVGHACLAHIPLPVTIVDHVSAFFCTYIGGPINDPRCRFTSLTTKETVTNDTEMARIMKLSHAQFNITREQEDVFINVFLLALQSVFTIEESTVVAFNDRLHALDTEIVDPTKSGCPHVASVLPWTVGQQHHTEINVGDLVTWVWEDDEPHSIKVADGLGDNLNDPFQGYGAGRLIVSRNTVCSPDNIGPGDMSNDPVPCTLQPPGVPINRFSYTKIFREVGNVTYVDGRNEQTRGVVTVKTASITKKLSIGSLAKECSPGCSYGMVRNGICDTVCNYLECAFDGGDCSCSPNEFGMPTCSCPAGQTHSPAGSCCQAYGVGNDLTFSFGILTWGPNVTATNDDFLPRGGPPLFRYVAVNNRVLVGMSLMQTRWGSQPCKEGRFFNLFPNCTHSESTASYGVNPVFLPKSKLYNPAFAANDTSYYANYSLGFNNDTIRNNQGIPYGFEAFGYKQSSPTFRYIIDLNFNNEQATEALQYMQDGFFIDNATKSLTVELITYNGVAQKFTLYQVLLTFQTGGLIAATYDIQSISTEPYLTPLDWFRMSLEIIFVLCVCWNVVEEVKELLHTRRHRGILAHFAQMWNLVDFISLSIMVGAIIMWINFVVKQALPFDIKRRYRIYDIEAWQSPGQYWNIVPPGDNFAEALAAFKQMSDMVYFRTYYVALNGINVLLMVLRILKLMDFQPRMGTITRTVAAAMPDLIHFFILFFIVFFAFAIYGHLVFGRSLTQFSTLPVALVTCFSALLGNDSTNDFLMQLQGWELVAAVIFWWSYILIMVFIVFNLLIAIIVEAFVKVREDMEQAPSMPSELVWIVRNMGQRMFTPVRTDKELMRHLRALGAERSSRLGKTAADAAEDNRSEEEDPLLDQQVLKLDGREMDMETLEAILERARRRKEEAKLKTGKEVEPQVLARVLFNQFREETKQPEAGSKTETEQVIADIEVIKKDMSALKGVVELEVGALKDMMERMMTTMASVTRHQPATDD